MLRACTFTPMIDVIKMGTATTLWRNWWKMRIFLCSFRLWYRPNIMYLPWRLLFIRCFRTLLFTCFQHAFSLRRIIILILIINIIQHRAFLSTPTWIPGFFFIILFRILRCLWILTYKRSTCFSRSVTISLNDDATASLEWIFFNKLQLIIYLLIVISVLQTFTIS